MSLLQRAGIAVEPRHAHRLEIALVYALGKGEFPVGITQNGCENLYPSPQNEHYPIPIQLRQTRMAFSKTEDTSPRLMPIARNRANNTISTKGRVLFFGAIAYLRAEKVVV